MAKPKLAFVASKSEQAQIALARLTSRYTHVTPKKADIIVALGGDGFMLQTQLKYMSTGIPVYGVSGLFNDIDDVRAHGQNERIRIESFFEGQEFLYQLTQKLSRSDSK